MESIVDLPRTAEDLLTIAQFNDTVRLCRPPFNTLNSGYWLGATTPTENQSPKQQRLEHCNQLLQVISRHGRRFLYNAKHDRVASLDLDARGRVWFIDDYSSSRIYTHCTTWGNKWRGFSHGGTLHSLVEALRDYIVTGELLPRGYIAPERSWTDGDIWDYGPEAARAVRGEAYAIPMFREHLRQEAA